MNFSRCWATGTRPGSGLHRVGAVEFAEFVRLRMAVRSESLFSRTRPADHRPVGGIGIVLALVLRARAARSTQWSSAESFMRREKCSAMPSRIQQ